MKTDNSLDDAGQISDSRLSCSDGKPTENWNALNWNVMDWTAVNFTGYDSFMSQNN